jgi:signal transduction histidine kinase
VFFLNLYPFGYYVGMNPQWEVPVFAAVGTVLLPAILAGARLLAILERTRARTLLDMTVAEPVRARPSRPGLFGWVRHQLTDLTSWRALLYVVSLFALAVGTIAYTRLTIERFIFLTWDFQRRIAVIQGFDGSSIPASLTIDTIIMSVYLLIIPFGVALLARISRMLVMHLLGPSASERARALERGRDSAVGTAIDDLRRIERDLHDGVQARLVSLTMELGRVRKQLESDPQTAGELLEHAHSDAKLALAELRDLARGIYPAVLTDRGLDPALSALAARMPVPVSIDVVLPERLAAPVETGAYFVIAELLTNVAKHSQASNVAVMVRSEGEHVVIDVTDDGCGGAVAANGGGLAGLRERVAALEGSLTIDSPTGGPTRVTVEIPCRHHRSASS